MKGISAIITVVLLLLIAVALVSLAFVFFGDIFRSSSAGVETEIGSTTGRIGKTIIIDSIDSSGVVYIRSIGLSTIEQGEIALFNEAGLDITTGTCPTSQITAGSIGQCNYVIANCAVGELMKATAPGNIASSKCP